MPPTSKSSWLKKVLGMLKSSCYKHPRTDNNKSRELQGNSQIPEKLESMETEMQFFYEFESQYGPCHPFFYACSLTEALKIASNESKFVFVYLHLPDSPLIDMFCKRTLCSELVVQFLDANFVSWGAFGNKGEGSGLAGSLKVDSFPCCVVIARASGDNILALQKVEGPVSPEALMEILHRTLAEQGSALNAVKIQEELTRRENQELRRDQDAAYQESLTKDKEKEIQQKSEAGKGYTISTPKKGSSPVTRITKGTRKFLQTNGSNGSRRSNQITKLMIRLPNGERVQCSVHPTDTVKSIYDYIDSLEIPGIGAYHIVTNFPKRVYGHDHLGIFIKDAGFHPSATLFVEKLPDST